MDQEQRSRADWQSEAALLGVDPNDPSDGRFWAMLDRARGLLETFEYHQPTPEQIERIARIRKAHIACARIILQCSPVGPDQTAALRKLHESMMTSNKAIVCEVTRG